MKALRINQWGQPAQEEEIPQPKIEKDEVLVRVHASSINPVDQFAMAGYLKEMLSLPFTPGTDFAGEAAEVGAEVTHVRPGDAVYGMVPMRGGAFAEYAVVKAQELSLKPKSLDFEKAAAVPLVSIAAWQTAVDFAQIQKGERVLIHGAGGNVGSVAVQLAKMDGAYVIAADVPEKGDFLQSLSADEIIDITQQQFEDVVGKVDVVLNYAKADLLERSYSVLKVGGRYATTFEQPSTEEAEGLGIRSFGVFAHPSVALLDRLAELIDAGKLRYVVSRTFPLEDLQSALAFNQQSAEPGKVVLTLS